MGAHPIANLMVEREALLMAPTGGKPTPQVARFLLPSLNAHDATPPIMLPRTGIVDRPSSSTPHNTQLPLIVAFDGWRHSTRRWEKWVSRMRPRWETLWKSVGIFDAIASSVCNIVQHKEVILELPERWSSETNSFLFPWGEATITLEDVAVIGGYGLGDFCVLDPLDDPTSGEIENVLRMERTNIQRTRAARAFQTIWLTKFMDTGSVLEHEAFLCFWLSRFVFPGPAIGTIRKCVIPVAIHLDRGMKLALAPAVLASIYRDFGFFKRREQRGTRKRSKSKMPLNKITLWAPFQLVQVWIWERFESFRPTNVRTTQITEPRISKWHWARPEGLDIENLARVFDRKGKTFAWRPYNTPSYQGFMSELYGIELVRYVNMYLHREPLEKLVHCIRVSEMVGVDGDRIGQYLPHRVAMQFGFNQDIPIGPVARQNETPEMARKNYKRPIMDGVIHVPPRFCEPQVTTRYHTWKRSMMFRLEGQPRTKNEVGRGEWLEARLDDPWWIC